MFDDIIRTWLEDALRRPDLAKSTKVEYRRIACHLIDWPSGDTEARMLTDYVAARPQAGIAPRTIVLELRVLSVATHWAERHRGAPRPPVLPRIKVDHKVFVLNHRTPTPSEAAAAIRAMAHDDWRLAVRLLAATGARAGEVLALRCSNLDRTSGRLARGAREGAAKTGMRWFPLDAATLRALEGRRSDATPLFDLTAWNSPLQALQRRLRNACRTAGVPVFTPHGLRRMVVGRLIRAQVDPASAASLTGHSIDVMLKHYREVTDEDRRTAAERAMIGVLNELPSER